MHEIYNLEDVADVASTILVMETTPSKLIIRGIYQDLVDRHPLLMTILYSVADEILKPFPVNRRGGHNVHINAVPQALGDVLYAVTQGNKLDPTTLTHYDRATKIIIDFVCSHQVQTIGGVTWTASIIPDLLGLPKLLNDYVILPDFIARKDIQLQNLRGPQKIYSVKYPAFLFKAENKGKGKLCYFIKNEEGIHSNIQYIALRKLLTETLVSTTVGIIGYVAKYHDVVTYHPICSSNHIGAIKKLYQGKAQTQAPLDYDMATLFRRAKGKTINLKIKIPKLIPLKDTEEFHANIKSWTKRRVQAVLSPEIGIVELSIERTIKLLSIVDFILDDNYMPKGVYVKDKENILKIHCKVPDDVVQQGLLDAYAEIRLEVFQGKVLRGNLVRFMDSKYHSCTCCGDATKDKLCSPCYGKINAVVNGTLEDTITYTGHRVFRDFSIKVKDYNVVGAGEDITFTRNTEGWKGQRGLPLFPADFGLQVVG